MQLGSNWEVGASMKTNLYDFFYYLRLYKMAGIPIADGILYYSDICGKDFKPVAEKILLDLHNGKKIHEALKNHNIFSDFIIQTLKFSDKSGQMTQALNEIVFYLEQQSDLERKIFTTLLPIIVLLIAMFFSIIVTIFFVIPSITKVVIDVGATLPLITKIVISTDKLIVAGWPVLLLLFILSIIFLIYLYKNKPEIIDKMKWKLPFYRGIYRNLVWYRMSKILSLLTQNEIPITESLEYVANTVGCIPMKNVLLEARNNIPRGLEPAKAIMKANKKSKMIDYQLLLFIEAGAGAGQLPQTLNDISELYRKKLMSQTEIIGQKISIMIMMPCAVILGIIVGSVYLPLYGVMDATVNMMQ